jgi:predicted Zn-dependent protease
LTPAARAAATVRTPSLAVSLALAAALVTRAAAVAQVVPARPPELAPSVRAALQSTALSDAERAALRLRHGIWDDGDLLTPADRAVAALAAWELASPALADPAVPAPLRAEARVRAGAPAEALAVLEGASGARADLVRALALDALGRGVDAAAAARAAMDAGRSAADRDARMDAVEATALLARLEGRPARDWQAMLDALAALRDADRSDPRPRLLEGRLLLEKDRFEDGVNAVGEAIARDLRSSEGLHLLGRVCIATFDFEGARRAAALLRGINAAHPLADLLDAEAALQSRDPATAAAALDALLARFPGNRQALAFRAAADGMRFDMDAMRARLAALDREMPGSPLGPYEAGRFLSLGRQYAEAAETLGEAARRAPGWSAPVAELGLMEMQSGRDAEALSALRRAVALDPYDRRASHSLTLAEMLGGWKRFDGERFTVRCKPGIDEALAAWMPSALDAMAPEVTGWLAHVPAERTVIELHPDHKSLAVRITGMPWIHTIAASTGPLIALEAPREGAPKLHLGVFDWLAVLRHEYVHTVSLDMTRNRLPHWFTEALATRLEGKPRSWDTVQLLARAFEADRLFDLDGINWAFIRPERRDDRQQAYAQGAWMVEFIEKEWGRDAILRLLALYRDGTDERRAFAEVLGIDRDEFLRRFRAHAERDLRSWGMLAEPPLAALVGDGQGGGDPAPSGVAQVDDARLAALLAEHPAHPDLLELWLRRRLRDGAAPDAAAEERLAAYSRLRPADPWPHRVLAAAARAAGDDAKARPHLEFLEAGTDNDAGPSLELARIARAAKNPPKALEHATRAARIEAYDPGTREFAAAVAIEAGDLPSARMHIQALTVLEPDEARHRARLARIDEMIAAPTDR